MNFNELLDFLYELESDGVISIEDQDAMTEKLEEFLENSAENIYNTLLTN